MKNLTLRKIFVLLLVITLGETLVMDWIDLRQTQLTDRTGLSVVQSFRVLSSLDQAALRFEGAVDRLADGKELGAEARASLIRSFERVNQISNGEVQERAHLADFRALTQLNGQVVDNATLLARAKPIQELLASMRDTEGQLLNEHLTLDSVENHHVHRQMSWTSGVDILLIGLLGLVYMYDVRNRRKTEGSLTAALLDLQTANNHLESLNTSKNEMLQHAAHDLRNPLGSIRGLADLIKIERENKTSVTEMSEMIRQITNRTLKLVDLIVKSADSNTEAIAIDLVPVRLDQCLAEASQHLQPLAQRKNQTIELAVGEGAVSVRGDWSRLEDAFTNLIGNGLKFSPSGTKVFARCGVRQGTAYVEIEDQGPGISTYDRERAFRSRQKLSATPTGDESSSGLGLYIVKQTIEAHGGRVSIGDPRPGRGAVFVVELPVHA